MRKTLHILLIAFAALLFTTCQKKPEVQVCHLELTEETVTASDNSVTITAKYSYPGEIPEIKVCVSQHKNMSDAVETKAALTDSTLRATVKNLDGDTKYYYRYKYSNGIGLIDTEIKEFTTQHLVALPTVTTIAVSAITAHSATSGGNVTNSGDSDIIARGVCWSTSQNPTVDDMHTENGAEMGTFVSDISDLESFTVYYIRAYATNSEGTGYGNELMFVTDKSIPTIITAEVTEITPSSAVCGGEVTNDGGWPVTARGVCWSTEENPTIDDEHTTDGNGTGVFISNLSGLSYHTTYYVRAYATNNLGTSYGEQKCFMASDTPPTVTTNSVTNITLNSAVAGGYVRDDGGTAVTARGVCWSTEENPTIDDLHTTDGNGIGVFTSILNGLAENTTYFVRAYATNGVATAYGGQVRFTTLTVIIPTVTTNTINSITMNSANCTATVTSDGYGTVTERGICWDINPNPTINSNHITSGDGVGTFIINMTGLTSNTTYYVRAYAINEIGTAYGEEICFNTLALEPPTGALSGVFSVSATKQVIFSMGNLQCQVIMNRWRFAELQYTIIGNDNANISSTYNGWIDLFGWGTSGYNHGAVAYQPWNTDIADNSYYAYGNYMYNLNDQTGMADWGYNAIYNGGNIENFWRTLTYNEWMYLMDTRPTSSGIRYAKATVNGVRGVILLPDNWNEHIYHLERTNNSSATYSNNVITSSNWRYILEANGAVFLPTAGSRDESSILNVGYSGDYWTATHNALNSYCLHFTNSYMGIDDDLRHKGFAVRLVHDL